MCSAVDVSDDQSIGNAVQSDRALHSGLDASSTRCPDLALSHELDCLEEVDFSFVARVAIHIYRNAFHNLSVLDVWHDVKRVVQEGSVDYISRSPVFGS
jgi:hypothetical protein